MKEFLHTIKTGSDTPTFEKTSGYGLPDKPGKALSDVNVDSDKCFVKIIAQYTKPEGGCLCTLLSARYFVKTFADGRLYDHVNPHDNINNLYKRETGKQDGKFVEVSEKCFKMYTQFLKTNNAGHLIEAERENLSNH